ncbi:MAG: hypothetical protein ACSLFP_08965, partial [Acidimicrobiales bacterium]
MIDRIRADPRPWLLGALVAIVVGLGLAVLVLRSDDQSVAAEAPATSTTESTTTTTVSTTTTAEASTTTEATTTTVAPTTTR